MNTSPDQSDNSEAPVALITGGAQRIGACIAQTLHARGLRLIVHHRHSRDEAQALQKSLNDVRENSVTLVQGDLVQPKATEALVAQAISAYGRLDVVVNNASSFFPTPVGQTEESDWQELIGINLKAPYFLTQAAAPWLRESSGCVVNIVDIYAERPLEEHPVYCAAKAGLVSLTKSLARELAPHVRVNAVAPGAILWPASGGDDVSRQRIISRTPLKRIGEPSDIADAVSFFATDSSFVTGQILAVDGGRAVVP